MDKLKVAKTAAKWWAEKVTFPTFNNGDDSRAAGIAGMLAAMNSKPVTNDQKVEFTQNLALAIGEAMSTQPVVYLDVDYHPCQILANAAKQSGVSDDNFPWKHSMRIYTNKGTIEVSAGYRDPFKALEIV
jgi:ABC-type branched-subunit amino acid transport system substrate-binding protein